MNSSKTTWMLMPRISRSNKMTWTEYTSCAVDKPTTSHKADQNCGCCRKPQSNFFGGGGVRTPTNWATSDSVRWPPNLSLSRRMCDIYNSCKASLPVPLHHRNTTPDYSRKYNDESCIAQICVVNVRSQFPAFSIENNEVPSGAGGADIQRYLRRLQLQHHCIAAQRPTGLLRLHMQQ